MFRMSTFLRSAFLTLALAGFVSAASQPVAPVRPVVDNYHGTEIVDPYRWMENVNDPEVEQWMTAQAEYTDSVLAAIPGREGLLTRLRELDGVKEDKIGSVWRLAHGMIFYEKRPVGASAYQLWVSEGLDAPGRALVDPGELEEETGTPHAIAFSYPSPKGNYLVYGLSKGGDEAATLYIMETATGRLLDEPIDRTQWTTVGWLDDESGFFYFRARKLPPDADPTLKFQNAGSFFHRLGTSLAEDPAVFGNGINGVTLAATDWPEVWTIPGCRYAFGQVSTGASPEESFYYAPLDEAAAGQTTWKQIASPEDKVTGLTVFGDHLYLMTFRDAPRYKVIRTSLSNPDLATAEVVVAESEAVLQAMAVAADGFYYTTLDGGINRLYRLPYGPEERSEEVPVPMNGRLRLSATHPDLPGAWLRLATWTRASAIYAYDPATGAVTDTRLQKLSAADAPKGLVSREVKVRSHDGVMVPLSIIHREGLDLDGTNPTMLTGYGAYGSSTTPRLWSNWPVWYEQNGVLAIAHVRGGGEYGEEWHYAGFKETKPNTWKDFIACAEYLIAEGYTSPEHLAGSGTSAGGILIGRALTERPDLFAVAISHVGDLEMLRLENRPTGASNAEEFGTVKDPDEFRWLLAMSAFHHVENGVEYPAVMCFHGVNDSRVPIFMSTKMTARLQAATAGDRPILLRLQYESGHGPGATKEQDWQEFADEAAFCLWQFGVEGFQPR